MSKIATDLIGKRCAVVNRGDGTISFRGTIRALSVARPGGYQGKWNILIQEDAPPAYSVLDGRDGSRTPVRLAPDALALRGMREVGSCDEQYDVLLDPSEATW